LEFRRETTGLIDREGGGMKYLLSDKAEYESKLEAIRRQVETSDKMAGGWGNAGEPRLVLALALLDYGVEPDEDVRDGLLINGRIVVAINKNKYRFAQNYEWRRYYELHFVVAMAKGERYKKMA